MSVRGKYTVTLIVWIVSAWLAVPAGATTLLYLDPVAWAAATTGLTVINFEGLASPGVPGNYSTAGGLTLGGVQFIGVTPPNNYYLYVQDPGTAAKYGWGSGDVLEGPNSTWIPGNPGYIEATLPAGYTAVSAHVMTHTPYAQQVIVSIPATGESFTISTSGLPTPTFVGLISSDLPIQSVQFQASGSYILMDNFTYGQETPEAETLLLGGTGLLGLWIARRLRRLHG
jgi:hypothetical protein